MRTCTRTLVLLWLVAWPTLVRSTEPKAPLAKLELADGDSLVFLGDSITHQCLYTQYVEDYFYTRFPKNRIRFHNAGVGGDRAADALIRLDRDVLHYKPKYVTVLLGMNDGTYRPYDEATFQTYRTGMRELMDKIADAGATPILMTPTMFDSRAARLRKPEPLAGRLELYNSVLAYYGAWLREQALESGYGFVDMYSPLNNLTVAARKRTPTFTMIADAVHPDAPGQLVMSYALLSDLQMPQQVSSIQISRDEDGTPEVESAGGQVSQVEFTSDGLSFAFAAQSLPLALLPETKAGAELLRLPHRLSNESLEVHGLKAGRYQLLIDGQEVGTYTTGELEGHVQLENNARTPQHQQAMAVAELNRRRNDEAVHPLRDLWVKPKLLRITRAQLEANPKDEKLRKTVADLEAALEDFEAKIAELEGKSRQLEDKIYQINQPQPHEYRLVRL